MKMDFINMPPVLADADRKLRHYVWKAGYYMDESDSYLELMCIKNIPAGMVQEYHDQKDYYAVLARCELNAARSLISWLEEMELIDLEDWMTMNHTLVWMGSGIPEDRA